ncbi:hypothetical protein, partial [Lactiplantibacillus plantarum]
CVSSNRRRLRSSNCHPAPEVGIGRATADEQQSNWYVLIMIHANNNEYKTVLFSIPRLIMGRM